jgi:putative ABC transport system permease protein
VLAGLLYSALILWLLGNVWSGATHTEGFVLHVNALTLILGWLIGVLVCALSLWVIIKYKIKNYQMVNSK